jgi:hypothetical protein
MLVWGMFGVPGVDTSQKAPKGVMQDFMAVTTKTVERLKAGFGDTLEHSMALPELVRRVLFLPI